MGRVWVKPKTQTLLGFFPNRATAAAACAAAAAARARRPRVRPAGAAALPAPAPPRRRSGATTALPARERENGRGWGLSLLSPQPALRRPVYGAAGTQPPAPGRRCQVAGEEREGDMERLEDHRRSKGGEKISQPLERIRTRLKSRERESGREN